MRALTGYAEASATVERERLPAGGYVLKISNLREENYSWGDVVVLMFDIFEGEFKGFFKGCYDNRYEENEKWKGTYRLIIPQAKSNSDEDQKKYKGSLGFFKSQIEAFNRSNNINIDCSKEWDINVLKNKIVGAVFNEKEWEFNDKTGFFTNCHHLCDANSIREGKFKIPEPTMLKNKNTNTSAVNLDKALSDFIETGDDSVPF